MSTRLVNIVFDAVDPEPLAAFWAELLGWSLTFSSPEECNVLAPDDEGGLYLDFVPVADARTESNRLHFDLASPSMDARDAKVELVRRLGGGPVDVGQHDVPWVVVADPEGNAFCVMPPFPHFQDAGAIGGIPMDAVDPEALAAFWSAAAGWPIGDRRKGSVDLRAPSGRGPWLEFWPEPEPKRAKNRLHLDVAPRPGEDQQAEVRRLIDLGARRIDIGQGDGVPWVVLADPEGNEFCVLAPR